MSACATSDELREPIAAASPTANSESAQAPIYDVTVDGDVEASIVSLKQALKAEGFGVLFEANIGASLAKNAERWGDDYNRSQLDPIRSILLCHPKYANQASNGRATRTLARSRCAPFASL